jgi:hypothetical protein
MAARTPKTADNLFYDAINLINQELKRFDYYEYSKEYGIFFARAEGYQIIYSPPIDLDEFDLFKRSFKVEEPEALFAVLKSTKEVILKDNYIIAPDGASYPLIIINRELTEQNYSILSHISNSESEQYIDGSTAKLFFDGECIAEDGFDVNILVDTLTKLVSAAADHTVPLLQFKADELYVYSEITSVDKTLPFIILSAKTFKKIKMLKKDVPFFNVYLIANNTCVIEYGNETKERCILSASGLLTI